MWTKATKIGTLLLVAASTAVLAGCDDDLTDPGTQETLQASVVHGINGTDIGAAEALPVDVSISGLGCVLEGVEFGQVVGPLEIPAGTADITVRLAADDPCTGDVAVQASGVELAAGSNVSIAAHLAEDGSPTATIFENDVSPADGQAKLSARHAAQFGPVDIVVDGSPVFEEVPNGVAGTAALDPSTPTVAIQTPDNQTTAFEGDVPLSAGTLTAVYAVGSVEGGTFQVLVQEIAF